MRHILTVDMYFHTLPGQDPVELAKEIIKNIEIQIEEALDVDILKIQEKQFASLTSKTIYEKEI